MGRGLLITGTDTGVGKTMITCGLASVLRNSGYKIGVLKPVETGCQERGGNLFPQDAYDLKQASGSVEPLHRICPYRFPDPLAPSVAAMRTDQEIDLSLLSRLYLEISHANDLTLVEGAGGLLVPLKGRSTYADLARQLELPVAVVIANRLGALNHAMLTLEHAACLGITVLGYVLNNLEESPSLARQTNARTLSELTSVPCLGEIPYLTSRFRDDFNSAPNMTHRTSLFRERINMDLLENFIGKG